MGIHATKRNLNNNSNEELYRCILPAMSDSNRRGVAALVLAGLFLLLFGLGWWSGRHDRSYGEQAAYNASTPRNYSSAEIQAACADTTGLQLIDCARGQIEVEREAKHAEDDLAAQNKMADWTFLMVIVSGCGLVATILGIWLVFLNLAEARKVTTQAELTTQEAIKANTLAASGYDAAYQTFDEARKANILAKEAMEIEQRPWLVLEVNALNGIVNNGVLYVDLKITATNVGKTPAMEATFDTLHWPVEGKVDLAKWRGELVAKIESTAGANAIFQGIVTTNSPFTLTHKMIVPIEEVTVSKIPGSTRYLMMVECGVSYRSVFAEQLRYSMKFGVVTIVENPVDEGSGHGGPQIFWASLSGGDHIS